MQRPWLAFLLATALGGGAAAGATHQHPHAEEEVALLQALVGSTRRVDQHLMSSETWSNNVMGAKRATMKAVVNNFKRTKDLGWLKAGGIPVDEVGIEAKFGKSVAETAPWFQWIADNYDNLPNHAVFLHGDESSWHSIISPKLLLQTTPKDFVSVVNPICRGKENIENFLNARSGRMLDPTFQALFGMKYGEAYEKWGMNNYRCCGEFVVSRSAMRKNDRRIYQALADTILRVDADWGHVIEWVYQNLFTKPTRPVEHVLKSLAEAKPLDKKVSALEVSSFKVQERRRDMLRNKCAGAEPSPAFPTKEEK